MSSDMRIRRDRSALATGGLFGRRRRGIAPWKVIAWLLAMGAVGVVVWQFRTLQPKVQDMVFGSSSTATPPAVIYAQAADLAFWRGDLQTALADYEAAAAQQPNNVDILYEEARMLVYHSYEDQAFSGDLDKAVAVSQHAIDAGPENPRAYTINCFALLSQGDKLEDAVRSCIRAIDLNPNVADAHAYLAATYFELSRYDTALAEAAKAVQLDPNSIDAHTYYALVLNYKGHQDQALSEYEKAAAINPQLEFPYFNLAFFALGMKNYPGQYDLAITAYNRVLSMDKKSVKAYTRLCETYYRMGEENLALDNCRIAIGMNDKYTAAHKWLGQVLYTNRDYEDAIVEFQTCQKQQKADNVASDSRLTECWYLQGLADFLLGNCDQAMPIFNDLLTWTHDSTAIRFTNTGINKCALAYSGQYLTPTPIPPTRTPPPPIQ